MAAIGTIRLAVKDGKPQSGAAFRLHEAAKASRTLIINGAEVEVCANNPYIVARLGIDNSPASAFDAAHEGCQRALDMLSIERTQDLSVRGAFDEHVVWWRNGDKLLLRVFAVSDLAISTQMQVTQMDVAGNLLSPPAPTPIQYHESFRYFRLAQVADDLAESFRNMYLAFELALSSLYPRHAREGEGAWLKRALANVDTSVPLSNAFTPSTTDIATEIHDSIYVNVRCALFHAKHGQPRATPHSLQDRVKIADAHDKLSRVVLLLARNWVPSSGGGVVTAAGFSLLAAGTLGSAVIILSEQVGTARSEEVLDGPEYRDHIALPSRHAPELASPGLEFLVAAAQPELLASMNRIGRVGAKSDDHLLLSSDLGPGIFPGSLDKIDIHLGLRLRNVGSIKSIYKS